MNVFRRNAKAGFAGTYLSKAGYAHNLSKIRLTTEVTEIHASPAQRVELRRASTEEGARGVDKFVNNETLFPNLPMHFITGEDGRYKNFLLPPIPPPADQPAAETSLV